MLELSLHMVEKKLQELHIFIWINYMQDVFDSLSVSSEDTQMILFTKVLLSNALMKKCYHS